ncbi:hypothetical protein [uncultured Erythrobacter sp.]|uniref:hypothetical protein n=1 Tax=uncultured Erythrobacter sp. TaxID=263913 RepID=UPI0026242AF2|nr:hypothetical protein [uncultured Erythrobacter sp.]
MFGADTPLVWDAIQIAGIAALAGASAIWLLTRRRDRAESSTGETSDAGDPKFDLESRVRVLERIATDRSVDLAGEIEALREGEAQ